MVAKLLDTGVCCSLSDSANRQHQDILGWNAREIKTESCTKSRKNAVNCPNAAILGRFFSQGRPDPPPYAAISTCRRLAFHRQAHPTPRAFASPRRLKHRKPSTCLIQPYGASEDHFRSAYVARPAGVDSFSAMRPVAGCFSEIAAPDPLVLPARRHIPVNTPRFQLQQVPPAPPSDSGSASAAGPARRPPPAAPPPTAPSPLGSPPDDPPATATPPATRRPVRDREDLTIMTSCRSTSRSTSARSTSAKYALGQVSPAYAAIDQHATRAAAPVALSQAQGTVREIRALSGRATVDGLQAKALGRVRRAFPGRRHGDVPEAVELR